MKQKQTNPDLYITIADACTLSGEKDGTIKRACAHGYIAGARLLGNSRLWVFGESDFRDWQTNRTGKRVLGRPPMTKKQGVSK